MKAMHESNGLLCISLITDSAPLSTGTWGMVNRMTAESLHCSGALGGPRCCKRDTSMALKTTSMFMKQNFKVKMDVPSPETYEFSENNRECLKENLPFHPHLFTKV